ncbi:MAG TPA: hypothetical protein VFF10_05005 [Trueperaceae bacterium]|nr:hypothetical protein [Trueperaceae bacterium]
MITRFGALMILTGLGVGLLLRVILGRRRMPALATVAHLPLLVHIVLVVDAGRRAGIEAAPTLLFAAAGLLLFVVGVLLARWLHAQRPWLAAVTPALTAAVYLALPVVLFNHLLSQTPVRLGSLASFGYGLATVFFVCALLTFAPRGGRAGADRLLP